MKKLKNDKWRKTRGGRAKLLTLFCEECGTRLFDYQKDGPGILKRLYLDRISNYPKWNGPEGKNARRSSNLVCEKCKELLGVPTVYKKEKRLAFRLFAGAVKKERTG